MESYVLFYTHKDFAHGTAVSYKFFNTLAEIKKWVEEHPDFWGFDQYKTYGKWDEQID